MNRYPFVSDLVLLLARGETPPVEVLREVARRLDHVLLDPDAFEDYVETVMQCLTPYHASIDGGSKQADELPYLRLPADATIDDVVKEPLRVRGDEWLLEHKIHLLALNLPALEEIQEGLMEEMSQEWIALIDNESWRRQFGMTSLPWDTGSVPAGGSDAASGEVLAGIVRDIRPGFQALKSLGFAVLAGIVRDIRPGATGLPLSITSSYTVSLDTATLVEHAENVPLDKATFRVERAGRSLKVRGGGFAFIDSGCSMKLRWLKRDGQSLNGEGAAQTIDRDEPIELRGDLEALDGQWLEFEFHRSGRHPYVVRGRFEL